MVAAPGQPAASDPSASCGPQRVVAVLGMHRSGTSLLAGTLEECGLHFGEVSTAAPHNEKGNRESWLLIALHEDLLRRAGGAWDQPPEGPVSWGGLHQQVRDLFIASFAGSPMWGFKDPRLLLVLPGWLDAIPSLETVGIFRHPHEVARSLHQRTPARVSLERGLELWISYNRRLYDWHCRTGCPLLEFRADQAGFNAAAASVARGLGLHRTPAAQDLTFYERQLRHQQADQTPLPPEVEELYGRLRRAVLPAA